MQFNIKPKNLVNLLNSVLLGIILFKLAIFFNDNSLFDEKLHGDENFYIRQIISLNNDFWSEVSSRPYSYFVSMIHFIFPNISIIVLMRLISILMFLLVTFFLISEFLHQLKIEFYLKTHFAFLLINILTFHKYIILGTNDAFFLLFICLFFFLYRKLLQSESNILFFATALVGAIVLNTRPTSFIYISILAALMLLFHNKELSLKKNVILIVASILLSIPIQFPNIFSRNQIFVEKKGDDYWKEYNQWHYYLFKDDKLSNNRNKIFVKEFNEYDNNNISDKKFNKPYIKFLMDENISFILYIFTGFLKDMIQIISQIGVLFIIPFLFYKRKSGINLYVPIIYYIMCYFSFAVLALKFVEFRWLIFPAIVGLYFFVRESQIEELSDKKTLFINTTFIGVGFLFTNYVFLIKTIHPLLNLLIESQADVSF